MIVTVVTDVLGEANNGTTVAAMNLIRSLTAKGHTVRVLCPDADKKGWDHYYVVPTLNFGPFQFIVERNGVTLARGDKMTIARAIHDVDEIHIMMPFHLGRKTLKIARRMGIPTSAGFHVQAENVTAHFFNWMDSALINHWVYLDFYSHFYKYIDAIHFPTQFIRDVFERNVHHHTNGYVISNGVAAIFHPTPVQRPSELQGKFVIICTGRYSKEKQQKLLIEAQAYSRHKDEIQILFAGEGPRIEELKRLAKKKGVNPIFKFFTHDELAQALNCADLYVHTSAVEIEAISCLEAISCGLVPLINNSPKSATRYFALEKTNLFKKNDPKDLARKIDYWIEHPEEKKALAEKYAGFAGRFNFDHCMDEMEKMIEETAKKRKSPKPLD
jgi:1,2-diacylglycerol 3-alpha-glucosyltransferase